MTAGPPLITCSSVATRSCADCEPPFTTPWGEEIQELCGVACSPGCRSHKISVARICFPPGVYSRRHFHPDPTEEVFYVLSGVGEVEVGGATKTVCPGDSILVPSNTSHQIGNAPDRTERLETLVVCVPAWEASNTTWLDASTNVVGSPDRARKAVEPKPWAPLAARRRAHFMGARAPSGRGPNAGLYFVMSIVAAVAVGCVLGRGLGRR